MSAHAKLAAMAATQAAMADLLRRIGQPDAAMEVEWVLEKGWVGEPDVLMHKVRARVDIGDEPVNGAIRVVAELIAVCRVGAAKARVAAFSLHLADTDFSTWCNTFRFQTTGGKDFMAPRTLASMVLAAMAPEAAQAA